MRVGRIFSSFVALTFLSGCAMAQTQQPSSAEGVPTHVVVTVEPKKGSAVPVINQDDVMVYEKRTRDRVTEWTPATGDHAAAGKSLRLPLGIGGANASPYFSLSDLVKRWPDDGAPRRAVMMITDGIDQYYGGFNLQDPYLDAAIDDALRAHVMVSAIYEPAAGHFGHSYWETYWGQLYLAEVADQTGGEAYYIGFTGPPVAFAPYLDQMATRLSHQYLLTFLAQRPKKAGWQTIRLACEQPNVDLVSARRVWVTP